MFDVYDKRAVSQTKGYVNDISLSVHAVTRTDDIGDSILLCFKNKCQSLATISLAFEESSEPTYHSAICEPNV
jgi:hypothetical protein